MTSTNPKRTLPESEPTGQTPPRKSPRKGKSIELEMQDNTGNEDKYEEMDEFNPPEIKNTSSAARTTRLSIRKKLEKQIDEKKKKIAEKETTNNNNTKKTNKKNKTNTKKKKKKK
eukprot:175227_1